ncbi:DUF2911 domain-containing protein [Desertivirga xinjiangensis]|uniref:DUF2911 domain-containing protein n=1 Tax=Desertivirga xinjiangensis TaxID=539206 RepID=UPI00210BA791|nr:DUF2911 domain-containing protein [Pedobacter xinjiangensis]
MNRLFSIVLTVAMFSGLTVSAQQDKSKRVSPPAQVSQTLGKGATVTIVYSQPSLKGRKVGTDLATYGKVWRTGANEATVFEVSKDVKVEGKALPAGKYSLYTIPGEKEWTIIFNKSWDQWGTKYSESQDQLRVSVKPEKTESFKEKMMFEISKDGEVSLEWGDTEIEFEVK